MRVRPDERRVASRRIHPANGLVRGRNWYWLPLFLLLRDRAPQERMGKAGRKAVEMNLNLYDERGRVAVVFAASPVDISLVVAGGKQQ
jgi:hypothetical protein